MSIKSKAYRLLRHSERYAKTDMVYLARGGFWLTFRQIIFSALAFLTAIAFARLLPKETYGNYKYILSITGILAISALSKIDTAVILAVARDFEGIVKEAFKTKIKWGLLGSLGALIIAGYFFIENNLIFALSFLIAAVFLPLMESSQIYLAYLSGKKLFALQAKYNSIIRIVSSLGIIAVLFLTKNIIFIILTYFALYTLLRIYFLHRTLKELPPNQKTDPQFIPYGKQLSFLRIFVDIANYLDKILVFKFLGAVQLAIYIFAVIPVDQINTILQSVRLIAMPKFSSGSENKIKKALPGKIIKAMLITIVLVVIYILLAPYLYQIFFPQYSESINYSRFYALLLILFPMTLIPSYFQAKIKKKEVYIFSLVPSSIRIVLLLILAPGYGIIGVISAIILASVINSLLALILFKIN